MAFHPRRWNCQGPVDRHFHRAHRTGHFLAPPPGTRGANLSLQSSTSGARCLLPQTAHSWRLLFGQGDLHWRRFHLKQASSLLVPGAVAGFFGRGPWGGLSSRCFRMHAPRLLALPLLGGCSDAVIPSKLSTTCSGLCF